MSQGLTFKFKRVKGLTFKIWSDLRSQILWFFMSKPWSSGPTLKLYLKRLCMRRNYEFIFEVSDSIRSHFYCLVSLSTKKRKKSDGTWPKCRNYFAILCLQTSNQNVKQWVSFPMLRKVKYIWMMLYATPLDQSSAL